MRKNLFNLTLTLIVQTLFSLPAWSCDCPIVWTKVEAAVDQSEIVALGTVKQIDGKSYRVDVERIFRKTFDTSELKQLVIFRSEEAASGSEAMTSCDQSLVPGKKYVVFARRSARTMQLFLLPCHSSTVGDDAKLAKRINKIVEGYRK